MKQTLSRDEFSYEVKQLSKASHARYGSYAYSTGYYESMIADMLTDMPKARREHYIETLKIANKELQK